MIKRHSNLFEQQDVFETWRVCCLTDLFRKFNQERAKKKKTELLLN